MAMPEDLLFELFDCAFGVGPQWERQWKPADSPAPEDIRIIEGVRLAEAWDEEDLVPVVRLKS